MRECGNAGMHECGSERSATTTTKPSLDLLDDGARDGERCVMRPWVAIVVVALTQACAPPPAALVASTTVSAQEDAAASRFVDSLAAAQRLPGFAVTVMQGGRMRWRHGVGSADIASATPATPRTLFRIGSVSKLLTAALLMRLSQERRIELDAPVGQYVDVPRPLADATLRQLAGHLGGVRHYRDAEFFSTQHYDRLTDAMELFVHDSL